MTAGRRGIIAVGLLMGLAQAGHAEGPATNDELVAFEKEWQAAFQRRDAAWIAAALAEDYVVTYGDGSVGNKASELKSLHDGQETITASHLDEFKVLSRDTFAIVNYRLSVKGTRRGKALNAHFRFTDVFERRAGRWLCVSSHNTHIGEPDL